MGDYKELDVWVKSHNLTLKIYKLTKQFPVDERFGLTSQIRRAASSIPTNITEGCGQLTKANFIRFLGVARGSALEVEYLLKLSKDLGYMKKDDYLELYSLNKNVIKMLNGLISSLKNKS